MQTSSTSTDAHTAERMSCPARLQEPETHEAKKETKLSRFFHKLGHKLKLSTSPEDDRESLLRHLGFGLDFVAVVQEPPQENLFEDAAVCLERLDRVKDVFVRSKEEVKGVGTVVRIEVTLKPRKNVPVQGIFHPGKSTKRYVLTRSLDECRKLLKVIQYCVSCKQPESSTWEGQDPQGQHATPCAYCAQVGLYTERCWKQPPLFGGISAVGGQPAMRMIVLTNSLNHFIHLARSQYPAAPTTSSDVSVSDSSDTDSAIVSGASTTNAGEDHPSSEDASATNTGEDHPVSNQQQQQQQQQQQKPATTPFCQAQAELAILLHDFFQLQSHV